MRATTLDLLSCIHCRSALDSALPPPENGITDGRLICRSCGCEFPIENEVVEFVTREEVSRAYPIMEEQARIGARFYDCCLSQFAEVIGLPEEQARDEYLSRLELTPGARILDIGVGTGLELRHISRLCPDLDYFGIDLSREMLHQCSRKLKRAGLSAELFVGFAEQLPFRDNSFDAVFHTGAVNEFVRPRAVFEEMARVAKPGVRIVVSDDCLTTEKMATSIGREVLKSFPSIAQNVVPPIDAVPADLQERRVTTIWNGFGYCLEFRKPGVH